MTHPRLASLTAAVAAFHDRVAQGKVAAPKPERKKRAKSDTPTEYQEQAVVCDWMKAKGVRYFAVPNGAYLSGTGRERGIRWNMMARIGAKVGVPDLVVVPLSPANRKPTTIEMKSTKGRCSPEQVQWHVWLLESGWNVIVGYGAGETIKQLEGLGYGR